ncbi:splicing factor PWI domain-containing protein [Galdieria sulphuraria]|uniref:Splicing factor PWI domain-containing protein n=1 Tax=Galdieria sulphuraria TaxID=130081 RepID=M2Y7R8_GALSU|nr:splicing factor PWI domain-containing protein [Galdieria sulphuraria]EME31859.1 splicing factor PWI domain-containing protein [Galdieria sulphuraria]|eukprot:XP_005708379.1 splicing factor PWI domain-containing protein [Galdieria sulphuraria]
MAAGFFRGTSFEQDARFSNKWKKLLSSTKFPEIYSQQVQTKLVQLDAIRAWVSTKLQHLLGFEDDVVVDFALSYLESYETPDPRELHLNLSGFLEDKTFTFMEQLWSLLVEAQQEAKVADGKVVSAGVPPSLVEELRKQLEDKQRTKETVEEQLRERVQNSPDYNIQPSRLPSEVETRERIKPSNWDSDSAGSPVRQVESTQAGETRRYSEGRHSRRSRRRRSVSLDRHRRRERTPSKCHRHHYHRHHRSHRHKLRYGEGKESSLRRSSISPSSAKKREEGEKVPCSKHLGVEGENVELENKKGHSRVSKDDTVEYNNSRDSLLAELARVERETELRRQALESMKKQNK